MFAEKFINVKYDVPKHVLYIISLINIAKKSTKLFMLYILCCNDGNTGIVYRDNKSLHNFICEF